MTYELLIDFPPDEQGRHKALYRLRPTLDGHELVVLSAVNIRVPMFETGTTMIARDEQGNVRYVYEPETYIFPSNDTGEILDFGELSGSQRETLSHQKVLNDLGYQEFIPRILTLEEETRPRFFADV